MKTEDLSMDAGIGTAAGKVWQYLRDNGPSPLNKIQKGVQENGVLTSQAIGWLAREGKITVDRTKTTEKYSLTE